ncbi:hypothetical protein AMJ49_06525 [Parcubacteria bacterium DG_74_2]|nr:MAG: hypothetical protein AMJ49_06525 [Parcubacteria bacterium DG_74_2]
MTENSEEKFDTGLAVLEMTRTDGWQWLEKKIKEELRIEYSEIREFEIAGKNAEQIASEYLQHRANINAYEKVLSLVETALQEKEEAAKALREK